MLRYICKRSFSTKNVLKIFHSKSLNDITKHPKKEFLVALFNKDYKPKKLQDSIWINPSIIDNTINTYDGITHIEITKDAIRLEFSKATDEYISFAEKYCNNVYNNNNDDYSIPIKVENKLNIGAGCTVYLSRHKISNYIKKKKYYI